MEHFNQLTPAQLERLALLNEEMHEAGEIICKILRNGFENYHPDDPQKTSNRKLLAKEIGHVFHAIRLMADKLDISVDDVDNAFQEKFSTVKKYLHHQDI